MSEWARWMRSEPGPLDAQRAGAAPPSVPALRAAGRGYVARRCGLPVERLSILEEDRPALYGGLTWVADHIRRGPEGRWVLDVEGFERAWDAAITGRVEWLKVHADLEPEPLQEEAKRWAYECLRKQMAVDLAGMAAEATWRARDRVRRHLLRLARDPRCPPAVLNQAVHAADARLRSEARWGLWGDEWEMVRVLAPVAFGGLDEIQRLGWLTVDEMCKPAGRRTLCALAGALDRQKTVAGVELDRFLPPLRRQSWPPRYRIRRFRRRRRGRPE